MKSRRVITVVVDHHDDDYDGDNDHSYDVGGGDDDDDDHDHDDNFRDYDNPDTNQRLQGNSGNQIYGVILNGISKDEWHWVLPGCHTTSESIPLTMLLPSFPPRPHHINPPRPPVIIRQ